MTIPYNLSNLYVYLTSFCNLNCRHCWIDPRFAKRKKKDSTLNYAELKRAILDAKKIGLQSVKLSGGEPFLYERILNLVKWLKKESLNTTIETNGTLIGRKEAQALRKAGVGHIAIALDGSNAELYEKMRGVKGSFEKAVNAIKEVVKAGLNLQIIFSLWRENKEVLKNTIVLAKNLGAKSFKINVVSHVGRGKMMEERGELLTIEEILNLRDFVSAMEEKLKFRIILDIPPAFMSISRLTTKSFGRCGIKNLLGILGDGSISICGIGTTVKELVFGNISNDSIADVWNKNEILQAIRNDLPEKIEGICGKCIFNSSCLGKCRAEAYFEESSLFTPFSFCQRAYEKGIFPESRMLDKRDDKDKKNFQKCEIC